MLEVGYSSHGCWTKLKEIYDLEVNERENLTFEDVDPGLIKKHNEDQAIWITETPIGAFRYNISSEDWSLTNDELKSIYPDYKERVSTISIKPGDIILCEDYQGGYLLVRRKRKGMR